MKLRLDILTRTILVLTIWFFIIYKIYIDFNHDYWFDGLIHVSLIVLASIVSLVLIYLDYKQYKQEADVLSFISTIATIVCITALIITTNRLKQQDKTQTILYASKISDDLSNISIDFRKNGTFKCGKSYFMGDSYYTRGSYFIKDSVVYLDKSDLFNLVTSSKLLMKTIPNDKTTQKKNLLNLFFGQPQIDTLPETFLYQLNDKGDTMSSAIALRVNNNILTVRR